MSIQANIRFLLDDIKNSTITAYDTFERSLDERSDFYTKAKNIANFTFIITKNIYKKLIVHYPKTVRIALAIETLIFLIFPSISRLLGLIFTYYLFFKHENIFSRSIRIYHNSNISEWSCNLEDKQRIVLIIDPIEQISNFFDRIVSYFASIFRF